MVERSTPGSTFTRALVWYVSKLSSFCATLRLRASPSMERERVSAWSSASWARSSRSGPPVLIAFTTRTSVSPGRAFFPRTKSPFHGNRPYGVPLAQKYPKSSTEIRNRSGPRTGTPSIFSGSTTVHLSQQESGVIACPIARRSQRESLKPGASGSAFVSVVYFHWSIVPLLKNSRRSATRSTVVCAPETNGSSVAMTRRQRVTIRSLRG